MIIIIDEMMKKWEYYNCGTHGYSKNRISIRYTYCSIMYLVCSSSVIISLPHDAFSKALPLHVTRKHTDEL